MHILSLFWHSVDSDSINQKYFYRQNPKQFMFKEQIKFITRNYTPISINDFIKISKDSGLIKSYSKPPVILGFDDGFKNVVKYALPVLNEFKVPVLFYVIGEIFKNPDFVPWYVEIKHMVRKVKKNKIDFNESKYNLESKQDVRLLRRNLGLRYKKCRSETEINDYFDHISNILDIDRPNACELDEDLQFINKEDILKLDSQSLMTVSSHAMTHRLLGSLPYEEQVYELEQSHLLLSQIAPSYYPVIAYPEGSFNKDTLRITEKIYKAGFAVTLGASYNNLFAYPRVYVSHISVNELAYTIHPIRIKYLLPAKRFMNIMGIRR